MPSIGAVLRDRDSYLDPFDKFFDVMIRNSFPNFFKSVGIDSIESGYPRVNILSYPDKITITADIAGMSKDDIQINVHTDDGEKYLSISGKTSKEFEKTDGAVYLQRELKRTSFSRTFKIGTQLDDSKIDADFVNGLLTVTIPKIEKEVTSKRIEVK